jgi:hypothetical protein
MIGTSIHDSRRVTSTRVYSCDELGACQLRTPRCQGCTVVHVYPQPRKLRFAPGVIDAGQRRARFEWLTTRRAVSAGEFIKGVSQAGGALILIGAIIGLSNGGWQHLMRWLGA